MKFLERWRARRAGSATHEPALLQQAAAPSPGLPPPTTAEAEHLIVESGHLREAGRLREALDRLERASTFDDGACLNEVGIGFALAGRMDRARDALTRAAQLLPDTAAVWNNLGNCHLSLGDIAAATANFEKAVRLQAEVPEFLGNLANAHERAGHLLRALELHREVLRLRPNFVAAEGNLATTLRALGRASEALATYNHVLAQGATSPGQYSNRLFCMQYVPEISPQAAFAEHGLYEQAFPPRPPVRHINSRDPARPLRVGYVSPDFRMHSCAAFFLPLIEHHDAGQVQAICYSKSAREDAITERIRRAAKGWRRIHGRTDEAVATMIAADGIDILVDMAGHTSGNRLRLFTQRPAPVQMTWLGYPGSTGLSTIGHRICDEICDPPETEALSSEAIVRLDGGFHCYRPLVDAPPVRPRDVGAPITFGSFNTLAKLSPPTIALWAEVLRACPDSRLLMKSSGLGDAEVQADVRARFAAAGIDPSRIDLYGWMEDVGGHLGTYARMDIGLDPIPYNGTTTTCEALWMGVPVITLRGDRHRSRVGESLLTHLGAPELIARDRDDYVRIARELVADIERLKAYRGGLRQRMERSPLRDEAGFARKIEAAYRNIWRGWCAAAGFER